MHNRVSRFTANGDVAVAGSELVDPRPRQPRRARPTTTAARSTSAPTASSTSPSATTRTAPTRRRSTTGSARCCASTPTARSRPTTRSSAPPTGSNRAIWALGLRNPFTFAFQPGTGRMFINDVGAEHLGGDQRRHRRLELRLARRPRGRPANPRFRAPLFAYGHGSSARPAARSPAAPSTTRRRAQFPADYVGDYFFADFCSGWIRVLDPASRTRSPASPPASRAPVDLQVAAATAASTTSRAARAAASSASRTRPARRRRSRSSRRARPSPSGSRRRSPSRPPARAPLATSGSATASNIAGATSSSYTLAVRAAGRQRRALPRRASRNAFGSATSNEATLTVTANQRADGDDHRAGGRHALQRRRTTITYAGTGTDPEDGTLAGERLHLAGRLPPRRPHPPVRRRRRAARRAARSRSRRPARPQPNVWYRIHLTVTRLRRADAHRRSATSCRATVAAHARHEPGRPAAQARRPAGRRRRSPSTGVVGDRSARSRRRRRRPSAARPTSSQSWSDGGARRTRSRRRRRTRPTPRPSASTRRAGRGLSGHYYNNPNLTGTTVDRVDPTVDFDWGTGAPRAGIAADTFSVRWIGQVQAASERRRTPSTRTATTASACG